MQDIQELCDRVIIIDHGTVVFDDTLASLIASHSEGRLLRLTFDRIVPPDELSLYGRVIASDANTATLEVARQDTSTAAAAILTKLPVIDITIDDMDAEEIIRRVFTKTGKLPS
jgi:ABC-2 type transport system ATP-binding protein